MKSTDTKIGAQNQSKQLRISNLCCHYPALPFSPCKNQTWFIHNPLKFPAFFPVIHSNPIIPLDQPSTSWHPGRITKGRIHPLKSIYQPGWNEYPGFPGETDQRRCKISIERVLFSLHEIHQPRALGQSSAKWRGNVGFYGFLAPQEFDDASRGNRNAFLMQI